MSRNYIINAAYALFSVKRREPGQPKDAPRILKFTYETPHTFDQFWWDFDLQINDKFAQYFHVGRALQSRKLPGYLLAIISYLVTYACSLEVWVLISLWLTFHEYDSLALWMNHMLLANCLITQAFKRFILRRRPFQYKPPRAFLLTTGPSWQRSSSIPSRVVATGTTMVYCFVYETNTFWQASLWSLLAFFVCSFARIHLGYNYPSDCILSLPIAYLTIGFAHLVTFTSTKLSGCQPSSQSFSLPYPNVVTLNYYLSLNQNSTSTALYATIGTLIFCGLTSYPVEFWRKTPYMLGNILAIYLFHNILLCPSMDKPYMQQPNSWMKAVIYVFLGLQYFQIYVISNLLGRRTGHILSLILRTIVFAMICGQSLITLIIYRLVKESSNIITQ